MRSGGRIRPLVAALAVLVLVGVVAVAATGSTSTGTSDGRRPSDLLLDTFFSLGLVALIPGAALFIWALAQRKEISREIASGRYPRTSLLAFAIFIALFTAVVYLVREHGSFWGWGDMGELVEVGPDGTVTVRDASAFDQDAYQAEFAWVPVLVVVALVAAGAAALVLASRRRGVEAREAEVAEELADVLEETLDDLRAERDARRAIIAAYARLERALAAAGLPRLSQETASEYVPRVLAGLEVDPAAIGRLTELYTQAKFSRHDVDTAMKLDAIAALERVRNDLRAAARRAVERVVEGGQSEGAPAT